MTSKTLYLIAVTFFLFTACKSKKEDAPIPVTIITVPPVAKNWKVTKSNPNDTGMVKNGGLYLSATMLNGGKKITSLTSTKLLKGDFELTIDYSGVNPKGDINTLNKDSYSMELFDNDNAAFIRATTINGLTVVALPNSNSTSENHTATSGTLYIKRTGANLTGSFTYGTYNIEIPSTTCSTSDLSLIISVYKASPDNLPLHVNIEDIKVVGAEIKSETFDTNVL